MVTVATTGAIALTTTLATSVPRRCSFTNPDSGHPHVGSTACGLFRL
jgi:hypothetical protein